LRDEVESTRDVDLDLEMMDEECSQGTQTENMTKVKKVKN